MDQSTKTTPEATIPATGGEEITRKAVCPISRRAQRLFAFALGTAVFLGVASVIRQDPRPVNASTPTWLRYAPASPRSALPLTNSKGGKLLGALEGTQYRVLMYSSPAGPRYTISTLNGKLLRADLAAEDVYREFPGLDLTAISAGSGSHPGAATTPPTRSKPLMMVDTPSEN